MTLLGYHVMDMSNMVGQFHDDPVKTVMAEVIRFSGAKSTAL